MDIALYIISILWIVMGVFLIIYTERTREILRKIFFRENVRPLGVLPVIFGLILLVGAFYHREMFWLISILGVLGIIKGIYLFIGPSHQIRGLFEWWFHRASETTVRVNGLIAFILGIAVLSYLM